MDNLNYIVSAIAEDSNGASTQAFTLGSDSSLHTTLKANIKKLQKENIKNSALFTHSHIPTLFINAKGRIVDLNESAITLLGYSKKQLSTQQWYEKLLPDERSVQIRHQIHQRLKTEGSSTFNAHLIRADGKLLEIDYTISRLPQPLNGSLLTLIDVTNNEALRAGGTG